jgi:hypothetical protein
MEELKIEIEEEQKFPLDHPERKKFQNFIDWIKQTGAEFKNIKLRFYSENNRGVHAKQNIAVGEQILFVPHNLLITIEDVAQKIPLSRKLTEQGVRNHFEYT